MCWEMMVLKASNADVKYSGADRWAESHLISVHEWRRGRVCWKMTNVSAISDKGTCVKTWICSKNGGSVEPSRILGQEDPLGFNSVNIMYWTAIFITSNRAP